MTFELIATADGSLTLRDEQSGELYHNSAGAYSEALVNYVLPSGVLALLNEKASVHILDVCFGLGYNSFVLLEEAIKSHCSGKIRITAIEPNTELLCLADKILSFEKFANLRTANSFVEQLSTCGSASLSVAELEIELNVMAGFLEKIVPNLSDDFDFVFHDPFSPKRAPELWTAELFQKYFSLLSKRKGAVLTYSAASAVRGAIQEVGFTLKRTSGLGAKAGGSIGFIDSQSSKYLYTELDEMEQRKLASLSGIPYRSIGFSLDRADILRRRIEEQARFRAGVRD